MAIFLWPLLCSRPHFPAPQPLEERSEGRVPKDRRELASIARDQAHSLNSDVIDHPLPVVIHQPVLHRRISVSAGDQGTESSVVRGAELPLYLGGGPGYARDSHQVHAL